MQQTTEKMMQIYVEGPITYEGQTHHHAQAVKEWTDNVTIYGRMMPVVDTGDGFAAAFPIYEMKVDSVACQIVGTRLPYTINNFHFQGPPIFDFVAHIDSNDMPHVFERIATAYEQFLSDKKAQALAKSQREAAMDRLRTEQQQELDALQLKYHKARRKLLRRHEKQRKSLG